MTVQCGEGEFRIERRATLGSRENCIDRVKMIDLATGTEVHKGEVPGKVLLGVPQSVFDSTACVRQLDVGALDGAGIGEAIENMLFSADATVSVKNALNKLGAARRLKINAARESLQPLSAAATSCHQGLRAPRRQRGISVRRRHRLKNAVRSAPRYAALLTLTRTDWRHTGDFRPCAALICSMRASAA